MIAPALLAVYRPTSVACLTAYNSCRNAPDISDRLRTQLYSPVDPISSYPQSDKLWLMHVVHHWPKSHGALSLLGGLVPLLQTTSGFGESVAPVSTRQIALRRRPWKDRRCLDRPAEPSNREAGRAGSRARVASPPSTCIRALLSFFLCPHAHNPELLVLSPSSLYAASLHKRTRSITCEGICATHGDAAHPAARRDIARSPRLKSSAYDNSPCMEHPQKAFLWIPSSLEERGHETRPDI